MAPDRRPASRDAAALLSPAAYDDDASSVHSRSDQDTDSDDDQLQRRARNSRELRAHDRIVLVEDDDVDRLVTTSRREQERQRRGSATSLVVPNPFRLFGRRPSLPGSMSAESLVLEKGEAGAPAPAPTDRDRRRRAARRGRRRHKRERLLADARDGEDGGLMYEMEAGAMRDGSSTASSTDREYSEDKDRRRLRLVAAAAAAERGRSWRRSLFVSALVAVGLALVVLAAWKLSKNRGPGHGPGRPRPPPRLVSNGTALFAPTTIIISLDGFRADFLARGLTPRLSALVAEGVSPEYMLPSFPSVTFPNHYTLATGLYPESHGIVGNTFWDPELRAEFYYTDPARSLDPKWWGGEPFWVTAELQGIRTAVHMWPGSEAHVMRVEPSFLDRYDGKEPLVQKSARILGFLDRPGPEDATAAAADVRPQLIAAYVPDVDADGHNFGPNSTEIRGTIQRADAMVDALCRGLEERNLTHIVNVVVVSDHGMATTDTSRLLQLEDLVDTSKIAHTDGWPLYGLRPRRAEDLAGLYAGLKAKAEANDGFDVYLRDVDMPARYHFANNERIAPLWIVPKAGWAIVTRDEFDVQRGREEGLVYHPRGLHGYDNEHPLMRAIFVARGPAFAHAPNSRVEAFRERCPPSPSGFPRRRGGRCLLTPRTWAAENIEVYNIVADSVGMEPRPNNGTLRLPLKPVGTHGPAGGPGASVPADPPTSTATPAPGRPTIATAPLPDVGRPTVPVRLTETATAGESAPTGDTGADGAQPDAAADDDGGFIGRVKGIWDWVANEVENTWRKLTTGGGDAATGEKPARRGA